MRPTSDSGRWMSGIDSGCSALAWRRSRSRRGPVSDVTGSASHSPRLLRPGRPSQTHRVHAAVDVHDLAGRRREPVGQQRDDGAGASARGRATSQPSGARSAQPPSIVSKPGIDLAAVVRIGPAETRLTRMPVRAEVAGQVARRSTRRRPWRRPSSRRPATRSGASNVRPTIDAARGSAAAAWRPRATSASTRETCSAVATSSHSPARKLPPMTDCGAKPIECTTPSSESKRARAPRSASAARSSASVTSSWTTGASSGRRRAIACVSRNWRPNEVSTHLGALLLGEPRHVEGDRAVREDAGDQELLAVEQTHECSVLVCRRAKSVVSGPCRGRRRPG